MDRWADLITSRNVGPVRGPATEANTFAVAAVHPNSIAAEAGITAGLLYRPTKPNIATVAALPERSKTGTVTSRFVDTSRNHEIELVTKGFPFGIELIKSPSMLARDVTTATFDPDALADFVHAGDRGQIEAFVTEVAEATQKRNRGLGDIMMGMLGRKTGASGPASAVHLDANNFMGLTPHAKLVAAFWLAANRQSQGARTLLYDWEQWGIETSGGSYSSLYFLTQALIAENSGAGGAQIREMLADANSRVSTSPLISAFWRERTEQPLPERPNFGGRIFPLNYRLAELDPLAAPKKNASPAPYLSLAEATSRLDTHQRLIVMLLGSYRANGFSSRAMEQLAELYGPLQKYYPEVHVVTSYEPGIRHNPAWMYGENIALHRKVKIRVLHDPTESVMFKTRSTRSPHVMILNRDMHVVHDCSMTDEGDLWAGLNSLPAST